MIEKSQKRSLKNYQNIINNNINMFLFNPDKKFPEPLPEREDEEKETLEGLREELEKLNEESDKYRKEIEEAESELLTKKKLGVDPKDLKPISKRIKYLNDYLSMTEERAGWAREKIEKMEK